MTVSIVSSVRCSKISADSILGEGGSDFSGSKSNETQTSGQADETPNENRGIPDENGNKSEDTFEVRTYVEDASPVAAGEARVNTLHASPDAPDLYVVISDSDELLFIDLPFENLTESATVRPGEHTSISVRPVREIRSRPSTSNSNQKQRTRSLRWDISFRRTRSSVNRST